jgi:hypothetical protein
MKHIIVLNRSIVQALATTRFIRPMAVLAALAAVFIARRGIMVDIMAVAITVVDIMAAADITAAIELNRKRSIGVE